MAFEIFLTASLRQSGPKRYYVVVLGQGTFLKMSEICVIIRDGSGFENLGYPTGFSNTRKARSPKIEKLAKPEKARIPNSKPAGFFGLYSSSKIPLLLTFSLCFLIKKPSCFLASLFWTSQPDVLCI